MLLQLSFRQNSILNHKTQIESKDFFECVVKFL